jgi:hypothetical protein
MLEFHFNSETQKHFQRHCHGSQKAGGTFLPFISHISDLVTITNGLTPKLAKEQGRMRKAFVFEYPTAIGYLGITKRTKEIEQHIEYEYRDRERIAYLPVTELPTTKEFTIVAQWSKSRWNIVTAYPGGASYPFPKSNQSKELQSEATKFWERHVLVKIRK